MLIEKGWVPLGEEGMIAMAPSCGKAEATRVWAVARGLGG